MDDGLRPAYWARRWGLLLHVAMGITALLSGPRPPDRCSEQAIDEIGDLELDGGCAQVAEVEIISP